LAEAATLVEQAGTAGLTMPELARRMGAGVTSLYWYFPNKDALLVVLAEKETQRLYGALPPIGEGPWQEELFLSLNATARELMRAPLYAHLFRDATRFDEELGLIRKLGVTAAESLRIHSVLSAFLRGFVLMRIGVDADRSTSAALGALQERVAELEPGRFPLLRSIEDWSRITAVSEEEFETELRLLIDGLAAEFGRPARRSG
jgi:AcrR family transcriptional regulator